MKKKKNENEVWSRLPCWTELTRHRRVGYKSGEKNKYDES